MANLAMGQSWQIWRDSPTSCGARTIIYWIGKPSRLACSPPPDVQTTHPETGTQRALFDFPRLQVTPASQPCRVIVATHPASSQAARIGTTRDDVVYELFFTALPGGAFSAADVVELYLHRGASAPVLSDEDQEQAPDRWCSHTACGQGFWQILCP